MTVNYCDLFASPIAACITWRMSDAMRMKCSINRNQSKQTSLRVFRNVFLQLKLGLSVQHNYWTSLELAKCLQKQFRFVEAAAFPTLCLRIIINLPLRWLLKFRAVVFAIHSRISRRRRMQYSVCLSV